jgi:hypothetical protein
MHLAGYRIGSFFGDRPALTGARRSAAKHRTSANLQILYLYPHSYYSYVINLLKVPFPVSECFFDQDLLFL